VAAALREAAAARRHAAQGRTLFTSPHFAVFPPEGTVQPHSAFEVIVQFQPDFARTFDEVAYVEVQGREARLPVGLSGQGLGPSVAFAYDSLDVGDVYIHTARQYTLELQNRGRVDAEWSLELPGGAGGAQWAFEPAAGTLAPGETLLLRAELAAAVLGAFEEVVGCRVKGSGRALELRLKGRVAGPDFEVDLRELDLGIVGCGFR
jgi:hydrocephalus-inducing protein